MTQPDDRTDEDLMLAYKAGESGAFELLLKKHKTGIYNFLYRLMGQEENVEEAFQEVFIRVIRSADNYSPQAKFSTWVYTIARNYCIDQSRKNRLRKTTSLDDEGTGEGASLKDRIADSRADTAGIVGAQNLESHLQQALDAINPDQREVFLLRERSGLSFEEIAQVVGSSVNTVKSRMRYALSSLQEIFKKLGITDLK